jgi:hypothetical protein
MDQWISQHGTTLLFVAAALATVIEFIWKPFPFCWTRMRRKGNSQDRSSSIDPFAF